MSGIMSMLLGAVSSAAAAVDEFFNRVTLLLPGNGTNGAQNNTFLDSSTNNFTITRNGNTTQGTFSPFSQTGWSAYLTGVYGSSTFTSRTLFNGNSTIEGWVYANALSGQQTIIVGGGINFGTNGAKLRIDDGVNAGSIFESTGTITANTWNYVAVVRSSNTFSFYINGNLDSSNASISSFYTSNATSLNVGAFNSGGTNVFTGYLSNIRVSNVARTISLPTSAYSSDANTVWLIFQSNRFVDNSGNAYALTFVGTPSVQAFSPFAPTAAYSAATVGGSGYFDASGDYLDSTSTFLPSSSTSTFTIEAYFYPTSFTNKTWLIGDMGVSGNYLSLNVNTSGTLELYWFDGSVKTYITTGALQLNAWNYIAAVVNSNAISLYLNSSSPAAATGTSTLTNRTGQFTFNMGTNSGSTTPNGFVSNVRVSTTARTISIPTAPYTSDANTRWLLNFTNAGITDATAKNDLETVGGAQISTTQSKFGGSSMYFDGTGDGLILPASPFYNFLDGNFTVEAWVYIAGNSPLDGLSRRIANIFSVSTSSAFSFNFIIRGDGTTTGTGLEIYNGTNIVNVTGTISQSTWHHIAVTKSGTSVYFFLNGTQMGTTQTTSGNWGSATVAAQVGRAAVTSYTFDLNGYIDDLRVTRGYARYTANFTAPTSAFALQ